MGAGIRDPGEQEANLRKLIEALDTEHRQGQLRGRRREFARWVSEVGATAWAGFLGLVVGVFLGVLAAHSVPDLGRWIMGMILLD